MKFSFLFIPIFISILLCSCMPGGVTGVSPEIRGYVLDAETGKPVADAKITYTRGKYSEETRSNKDGSFSVGPLNQWHYFVYIGSPGYYPSPANLIYLGLFAGLKTEKVGYITKCIQVDINGMPYGDDPKNYPVAYKWSDNIIVRLKKQNSTPVPHKSIPNKGQVSALHLLPSFGRWLQASPSQFKKSPG